MTPLLILIFAASAEAQFRAGVALVRVDAQVTDSRGQIVTGLDRTAFEILDNGQRQPILSFEHTDAPLDLLLLLDVSGSMKEVMRNLAAESQSAVTALHASDRAGIMFFAARTRLAQELTEDRPRISAAIANGTMDASLGGGTNVNSALLDAAKYLSLQPNTGRRAILIVTDNSGLNVRSPDDQVIRTLLASDIVLNAIVVGKNRRLPKVAAGANVNPDYTEVDVGPIAEASGGESFQLQHSRETLRSMIDRIRARYSMTFAATPGETGTFHSIQLRVAGHPDAAILARKGYYAAP